MNIDLKKFKKINKERHNNNLIHLIIDEHIVYLTKECTCIYYDQDTLSMFANKECPQCKGVGLILSEQGKALEKFLHLFTIG